GTRGGPVLRSGQETAEGISILRGDVDDDPAFAFTGVQSQAAFERRRPGGARQGRTLSSVERTRRSGKHLPGYPAGRSGESRRDGHAGAGAHGPVPERLLV